MTVKIHPYIQTVVDLLESSFQFAPKTQKSSKGWVETKFKASTARRFSFVDELLLAAKFEGEVLKLRYVFKGKGFNTEDSSKGVKKAKTEVEQALEPDTYLFAGNSIHHENVSVRLLKLSIRLLGHLKSPACPFVGIGKSSINV